MPRFSNNPYSTYGCIQCNKRIKDTVTYQAFCSKKCHDKWEKSLGNGSKFIKINQGTWVEVKKGKKKSETKQKWQQMLGNKKGLEPMPTFKGNYIKKIKK